MISKADEHEFILHQVRESLERILLPENLEESVFYPLMSQMLRYLKDLRLSPKTCASAVYYFANTVAAKESSKKGVQKKDFRNTAVLGSISLAVKHHESFCLKLNDLILDCGFQGSNEDIIKMEFEIIDALNWKMNPITPDDILAILIQCIPYKSEKKIREISKMSDNMVDLCLTEPVFRGASCFIIALTSFVCALEKYKHFNDRDMIVKSLMEIGVPVSYTHLTLPTIYSV
eukprot:TRINITY_DN1717_c0_g1_i12.p1 TRINITY_DN1717_c0_g1~~TRINITY_DN1717_c0_g1_i12.p1  ORF type:complete len:232 (-),score=24.30 TRINITY_DN1717_c0_g1_i12:36-731(-)